MTLRLPSRSIRFRELEQVGNYRGAVRARISTTLRKGIIEGLLHRITEVPLSSLLHGEETATTEVTQLLMAIPTFKATHQELTSYRSEFVVVKERLMARYKDMEATLNFPRDWSAEAGLSELTYCLVRHLKPRLVVETGVANGHLSVCTIAGLQRNGSGRLISIDVHDRVGRLLTQDERRQWQLRVLPFLSRARGFRKLMSELEGIDIFIHDSDHSYRWQRLEYGEALKSMGRGVILSDDVDSSFAFSDFCADSKLEHWYLFDGRKVVGVAPLACRS